MNKYHKIQTVYKRNPEDNFKSLLVGEFSYPEFEYLAHNKWTFTEKVDGTNIRVMYNDSKLLFGGKTDNASIPAPLVAELQNLFSSKTSFFSEMFSDGVCLYGEGYGARIQKGGGLYRNDQSFVLFDVKIGDWWLERHSVEEVADKLGIDVVPIIGTGTLFDAVEITRQGFTSTWGNFLAEGIVARPTIELKRRNGERIITKIKHRDFSVE